MVNYFETDPLPSYPKKALIPRNFVLDTMNSRKYLFSGNRAGAWFDFFGNFYGKNYSFGGFHVSILPYLGKFAE